MKYLSANPLFVPCLGPILRAAVNEDPSFNTNSRASFASLETGTITPAIATTSSELLSSLPPELGLQVLYYLSSKDIANLRLATRAFRQLPIFLFRTLVLREMPWLWEVWSDEPPYLWATVPHAVLEEQENVRYDVGQECKNSLQVISEEMPELRTKWRDAMFRVLTDVAARPDVVAECHAEATRDLVISLPPEKTNWYQLYTDITRNWDKLKALQNWRRIWGEIGAFVEFAFQEEWRARQLRTPDSSQASTYDEPDLE